MDCLTNGAMGEVVDFVYEGNIDLVLVHFYDEKVGKNIHQRYPSLQIYGDISVTPIQKIEFRFSMSK